MSRASSVEEIRERLAEIQDAAPERALALLSAHAPQDIAYLLEIAEAARGVLASALGEPDPGCACYYCDSREGKMYALRGTVTGKFVDPENGETRSSRIPWNDKLTEGALFQEQWQAINFIARQQDHSPAVEIVRVRETTAKQLVVDVVETTEYQVVGTI